MLQQGDMKIELNHLSNDMVYDVPEIMPFLYIITICFIFCLLLRECKIHVVGNFFFFSFYSCTGWHMEVPRLCMKSEL